MSEMIYIYIGIVITIVLLIVVLVKMNKNSCSKEGLKLAPRDMTHCTSYAQCMSGCANNDEYCQYICCVGCPDAPRATCFNIGK